MLTRTRHRLDQYAIFDGTAHDVFHLMNYLPAFLFPNDERKITEYGYSGISLGGHSTWLAVANGGLEDRLLEWRRLTADRSKIDDRHTDYWVPGLYGPHVGAGEGKRRTCGAAVFPGLVREECDQQVSDVEGVRQEGGVESFLREEDLRCLGRGGGCCIELKTWPHADILRQDPLVPWDRSKEFVEKLEVGEHGRKAVFVQEKTGHTCTHEMVTKIVAFLIELL